MKKIFILVGACTLFFSPSCSEKTADERLPPEVKAAFEQKFPLATNPKWGRESDSEWEVVFTLNEVAYSANFDDDGIWKETEYELSPLDMPLSVWSTLDRDFAGYVIKRAEISQTVDGDVYEVELKKGDKKIDVTLSAQGEATERETVEEDED